jgi:hypothetical protein
MSLEWFSEKQVEVFVSLGLGCLCRGRKDPCF